MAKVKLQIVDKLLPLITKPKRIKIAVGGRGSGKSIGFGDIMLMFADNGQRVCAAREFQNSIDDSVHENLKDAINRMELHGFDVQAKGIHSGNGGEVFYKGLARNITSIKSIGNVQKLWIEEGESISENSLKVLTPSIRSSASDKDAPEIWISMNRGSTSDAVAKKYLARAERELAKCGYYEDDLMIVVQINWRDNPWFPSELEQERSDDQNNLTGAEYRHIWEGEYYDEVENSIIPVEWFDAAIDAHKKLGFKPLGARIVSHDPSDTGRDPKGLCLRHGSVVEQVLEKSDGDVNDGCDWATDFAIDQRADSFNWDCDGLGVSLRRQVGAALDGTQVDYAMFKGSESPENPEDSYLPVGIEVEQTKSRTNIQTFRNKRAQYYWILRDRFYATYRAVVKKEYLDPETMISLSSSINNLEQLRAEVCRIPRKHNGNGMIQIMTKQEMWSKHKIPSPNMADALMMSMAAINTQTIENISFASEW
tara:strand:- start:3 stop:1445 length:1443 start_codon:yes stop_codon:yes gene_type:complete